MGGKQQDLRVTKTQRALAYAMLSLLEKNSFARITVNDLCQEALVSRSTFYAHFEDKYQLMLFCLRELDVRLTGEDHVTGPYEHLVAVLSRIREHSNIYRNIFMADPNRELLKMFQGHFVRVFTELLPEDALRGKAFEGSPEMLSIYLSGGLAAMLGWWIENDFAVSVEEMARCQWSLLAPFIPLPDMSDRG